MLLKPNQGSQRKVFTRAQYPQNTLFLPFNLYGSSTEQPFLDIDVLSLSVENATLTLRMSGAFTNLPSLAETAGTRSPGLFNQFVKQALNIGASVYTGDVQPLLSLASSLFQEIIGQIPTFELAPNEIIAERKPPSFPAVEICQVDPPLWRAKSLVTISQFENDVIRTLDFSVMILGIC